MSSYHYWQHFLALEADFANTCRFVELSSKNYETFSIEFAKLLLAISSEIDVLCKLTCERIDPTAPRANIDDYRKCLLAHTKIVSEEVLVRRYDVVLTPWGSWGTGHNPTWWQAYNNVKHERNRFFSQANLENCLNAISGLFVLVLYCHKAEKSKDALEPYPILLGREKEPGVIMLESDYVVPDFS